MHNMYGDMNKKKQPNGAIPNPDYYSLKPLTNFTGSVQNLNNFVNATQSVTKFELPMPDGRKYCNQPMERPPLRNDSYNIKLMEPQHTNRKPSRDSFPQIDFTSPLGFGLHNSHNDHIKSSETMDRIRVEFSSWIHERQPAAHNFKSFKEPPLRNFSTNHLDIPPLQKLSFPKEVHDPHEFLKEDRRVTLESNLPPRKKSSVRHEPVILSPYQKRKRYFIESVCRDILKTCKAKTSARNAMSSVKKKLHSNLLRDLKKENIKSFKQVKESVNRGHKVFKQLSFQEKKSVRTSRTPKKKNERDTQEQLKLEHEINEMKRQQRKLNYLITQTELFSHFMGCKGAAVNDASKDAQVSQILKRLDESAPEDTNSVVNEGEVKQDNYRDSAVETALKAVELQNRRLAGFAPSNEPDDSLNETLNEVVNITTDEYFARDERIFKGCLKGYQLKGVSWLAGLYDKGINGILADEMGLGKTVQTISFISYLAEAYSLWGPFLIIAPSSTLHNWQQEITRFAPDFNILPYWGNINDRKALRSFWTIKKGEVFTKESAPFHVLVTSYQLLMRDMQYFKRINWQYMVLDEAQAIKSSATQRWKQLLSFNCRNRLLLTGTPIQNSMAELWALLHFIMPTLFDSHVEFNEWFSKDIEGKIESNTAVDETQLSRLHMILKPFMLRRVKKEVERELTEKIEIKLNCQLSIRQKILYDILKAKLTSEEMLMQISPLLIAGCGGGNTLFKNMNQLMNIVVQFRKVCNHPDLFERRDVVSPFFTTLPPLLIPRLLSEGEAYENPCNLGRKIHEMSNILSPDLLNKAYQESNSGFGFLYFCRLKPSVVSALMRDTVARMKFYIHQLETLHMELHKQNFGEDNLTSLFVYPRMKLSAIQIYNNYYEQMNRFIVLNNVKNYQTECAVPRYLVVPMETLEGVDTHQNCGSYEEEISYPEYLTNAAPPKVVGMPLSLEINSNEDSLRKDMRRLIFADDYYFLDRGERSALNKTIWAPAVEQCLASSRPKNGWAHATRPESTQIIKDSGKMTVLHSLLIRLKSEGHRVLLYSQMTRMIDILEDYLTSCKYRYVRLDGSSRMSDRRETVADFQENDEIFIFLLSTRAGGIGINLTAADTVIFYDSDWNPTVDQQAMDRAHRLGQTKQVTVYRLICNDTVEDRILQRAQEKSIVQSMVISGTKAKQDQLRPQEVMSLLLDDDELQKKIMYRKEKVSLEKQLRRGKNADKKHSASRKRSLKGASTNLNLKTEMNVKENV